MKFNNAQIEGGSVNLSTGDMKISFSVGIEQLKNAQYLIKTYGGKQKTNVSVIIDPMQPPLFDDAPGSLEITGDAPANLERSAQAIIDELVSTDAEANSDKPDEQAEPEADDKK